MSLHQSLSSNPLSYNPLSSNPSLSNYSLVIAAKKKLETVVSHHPSNINLNKQIDEVLDTIYPQIWKLIQNPTNLEEIYKVMLKEQHIGCGICEQDILCLIQKLAESGLIDVRIEIK